MKAISQKDARGIFEFNTPMEKVSVVFKGPSHPENTPYSVSFRPMRNDLGMVDTLQPLREAIRKKESRKLGMLKQCFGASNMPTSQQIADAAHEVGKSLRKPVISEKAAVLNRALCDFLSEKNNGNPAQNPSVGIGAGDPAAADTDTKSSPSS